MADLIIQDTFEPYYAGREDESRDRAGQRTKQIERRPEREIILPDILPAPPREVRRERLPVTH